MEWVETTGDSVEAAKEAALDELGIDEQDAEIEVLAEARLGLFGRVRSEARVRARVRPTTPRAKEDRRDRRRRNRDRRSDAGQALSAPSAAPRGGEEPLIIPPSTPSSSRSSTRSNPSRPAAAGPSGPVREPGRAVTRKVGGAPADVQSESYAAISDGPASSVSGESGTGDNDTGDALMDVALDEQAHVAAQFLDGLIKSFGLDAKVMADEPEDDSVKVRVEGETLGILIGPQGATLQAIQELTRTAVQRETGASNGRLYVDIASYRQKRAAALNSFALKIASQVAATGEAVALEPMPAVDRKVVHDAIATVDGVDSRSDGEDERRHVVISRDSSTA